MMAGMSQLGSGIGQGASNAFTAVGSGIGQVTDRVANEKRMNRQYDAMTRAQESGDATRDEINAMYSPYVEGGQKAYDELWGEYNQMKNSGGVEEFSPSDVNQWLDPSLDYQQKMAQRAMADSQGASGGYQSSAGMQQMMEQNRQIGETGYGDARNFGYKAYLDKIANDRTDLSNRVNMLSQFNNQGQNALNTTANTTMKYNDQSDSLGLSKDFINAERSTLNAQLIGGLGKTGMDMASADSQVFGNMVGGMGGGSPVQGADQSAISSNYKGQGNTGMSGAQGQVQSNMINNTAGTGNQYAPSQAGTSLTAGGLNTSLMSQMGGGNV